MKGDRSAHLLPLVRHRIKELDENSFHLIHRDLIIPQIIQRRRTRRFMRRHLLCELSATAVPQIFGDSRRPERVIADEEANVNDIPGLSSALATWNKCPTSARHHCAPAATQLVWRKRGSYEPLASSPEEIQAKLTAPHIKAGNKND
jgi:hypothetical protein